MRFSVPTGQRRRTLDGLRLDPGDQRAQRQLAIARRALAIPAAQAPDGDAEVPREIEIGHIKVGPREADETVGHRTDRSRKIDHRRFIDHIQAAIWRFVCGWLRSTRGRVGADRKGSDAHRLGEIDAKPAAAALLPPWIGFVTCAEAVSTETQR
jgi:hypothetical protein